MPPFNVQSEKGAVQDRWMYCAQAMGTPGESPVSLGMELVGDTN